MLKEPPFRNLSPSVKVLALIMVMVITFLVVLALGVALSIPFFGRGFLESLAGITEYNDPRIVAGLKYFQIVNQVGVFIAPAILFVILTDDHFYSYLGMKRGFKATSIILGLIGLIVSLPFINWLVVVNGEIHLPAFFARVEEWMRNSEAGAQKLTDAFLATDKWGGFIVNLIMVGGLAAIGEEMIFRGLLVRLFREWTRNVHMAVLIPSVLFSAFHLQFYGFFGRLVLGVMLGYLFVWTGSLWAPIFVHFLNNAMAVTLSFMIKRGIIHADLETFGSSDNGFLIAASFISLLLVMTAISFIEQGRNKKRPRLSDNQGLDT